MEGIVFLSLAVVIGSDGGTMADSGIGLLTGVVLMTSCADRLAVVRELIIRLNSIETQEDVGQMVEQDFYTLGKKDEIMVIDASSLIDRDGDEAAYTLLVEKADGCWLILNATTGSATTAARLLHRTRKQGRIDPTEWTDVSFLKSRLFLNTDKALCLKRRPVLRGSHRPAHPENGEMSLLAHGDQARVMRAVSPADETKSWWLVTLTLTDGIVLQHVLPFETLDEALDLVMLIARTGAYTTDEFFDATEDLKSVQIDFSDEIEIDQDGKPRMH